MIEIDDIQVFINEFCLFSEEMNNLSSSNIRIKIVEDIYDYILKEDGDYATEQLTSRELYGLFYIDKKNEPILYIKQADIVNIMGTIFHELVHLSDFMKLSEFTQNKDYRQLQDNKFFILWSEFHADYVSYKYLIEIGKDDIEPKQIAQNIKQNLHSYYNSSPQLELEKTVDITVRSYGKYMALQNQFSNELDKYLTGFYFNQDFLNLYNFLWKHKSFESIKYDYNELIHVFENLEQ